MSSVSLLDMGLSLVLAFGLGLCLGCLIASTFVCLLLGAAALAMGAVIYFS